MPRVVPPIQTLGGGSSPPFGSPRSPQLDCKLSERRRQVIDSIVAEYSELVAGLESLTAGLHTRLSSGIPTTPRAYESKESDWQDPLAWEPTINQEFAVVDSAVDAALIDLMKSEEVILDMPSKSPGNNVGQAMGRVSTKSQGSQGRVSTKSQGRISIQKKQEAPAIISNESSNSITTDASLPKQSASKRSLRRFSDAISCMGAAISGGEPDPEMQQLLRSCLPCIFGKPEVDVQKKNSEDHRAESIQQKLFAGVESSSFDMVAGLFILANCVVMLIQLEYRGYLAAVALGAASDGGWHNAQTWFEVMEHIFNGFFVLELVLRFACHGMAMFNDKFPIFDVVLVVASSLQLYLLNPFSLDTALSKISLFRILRFIRLVRVLRIVRALRMFSALRVLVKTVVSSFGALLHSMIFLMALMIVSGLLLCELLLDFVKDESQNYATRQWVYKYYGTSSRAIYTLFEVTLAGCWPNYFRPLVHDVNGWYVVFSVVYISFVVFAVIRIITAIFLKHTMNIATNDADMMVQERFQATQTYVKKLKTLFEAVDVSGDGRLNFKEFEAIVQNQRVKSWLGVLELEIHDAKALFQLLDDGDGEVTFDEFLKGLMRLKGQARTMDVVSILHKTDMAYEELKKMRSSLDSLTACVEEPTPPKQ